MNKQKFQKAVELRNDIKHIKKDISSLKRNARYPKIYGEGRNGRGQKISLTENERKRYTDMLIEDLTFKLKAKEEEFSRL